MGGSSTAASLAPPSIEQRNAVLALLLHAPTLGWLKDSQGRYLYASQGFRNRFGFDESAVIGKTDFELFPQNIAEQSRETDDRVRANREPIESIEQEHASDGQFRHWMSIRFPVFLDDQLHVGGLAFNVSKYRQELTEAEGTFHQVVDAITDMVLVRGQNAKLLWANQAFLDVYGISKEQLEFILKGTFNEPDREHEGARDDLAVFTSGRTLDIPAERVVHYDGRVLQFHSVKSPIFDRAGVVTKTVSVSRDITEKSRLETELRQAQKLESVGRLAAGIAHEINTPVQFIGDQATFVQTALQDVLALAVEYRGALDKAKAGLLSAEDWERIEAAEDAADMEFIADNAPKAIQSVLDGTYRVARLVRAMKEFGHPDAGEKAPTDLNRALLNTITIAAGEAKAVADVVTDLGTLPTVVCHPSDLNQVFLNLFVNAAHAIGEVVRGTSQRGKITLTSRHEGDAVIIGIGDTGGGIAEEIQAKIFDPFFTTKEVGRGTGQGLAISRMIVVEKHGGTLTFDTEVGRGTTFHIRLPIEAPPVA